MTTSLLSTPWMPSTSRAKACERLGGDRRRRRGLRYGAGRSSGTHAEDQRVDQAYAASVIRSAAPTPQPARTRPPTAGPTKEPTLSIVEAETLAAVSSFG